MDHVKEWISPPMPELLAMASRIKDWKRISVVNRLSRPPDDPVGQGAELN